MHVWYNHVVLNTSELPELWREAEGSRLKHCKVIMHIQLSILLTVFCSLDWTWSMSLEKMERGLMEELVRYAKEYSDDVHLQKKELHKRIAIKNIGDSRRMMHQMKRSTPAIQAKEESATRSLTAAKKLVELTGLSLSELQNSKPLLEEWKRQLGCPSIDVAACSGLSQDFRTADGSCNNLNNPTWGAAGTRQKRYLGPVYDDDIGSPRTKAKDGTPLPSAREVSNKVFLGRPEKKESNISLMVMAWGQFVDHDITLTPAAIGQEGTVVDCCSGTIGTTSQECFPIDVGPDDIYFNSTGTSCLDFVRSAAAADSCTPNRRQQFNAITAFVDGSNVYGSSDAETTALRQLSGGLLAESVGNLPPPDDPSHCILNNTSEFCIKTGDVRANVVPHLGGNHVLFFREHNRIARELSVINPSWTNERLFQETRKIISGLMQQITYYEWLPAILSKKFLLRYGLTSTDDNRYQPDTNPSIRNGFAVAAMRFGHSLIPPFEGYLLHDYLTWDDKKPIEQTFFRPTMVIGNTGQDVPKLARWVCSNESMRRDRIFETGVRDLLFLDSNGRSFDLGAFNIQRGRDHAVPPYNRWRKWADLDKAANFNGLTDHNDGIKARLREVYGSVDDIDLFVGGISEKNADKNTHLGPTFANILAKQFQQLKLGDRFWFEWPEPEGFSPAKRDEIRKMTLAKVMCTNFNMDLIQKDVFHIVSEVNKLKSCAALCGMDLSLWKE